MTKPPLSCNDAPKTGRVRCEIYSRVVGYLRPVNQWNDGKQAEFKLRTLYDNDLKETKPL